MSDDIVQEIKDELHRFRSLKQRAELTKNDKIAFEQRIFRELMERDARCAKCPRTDNLTLDHIIAQALLADFGIDIAREVIPENYQLLCRPCNVFKADRLDLANPKTKALLLVLLERV